METVKYKFINDAQREVYNIGARHMRVVAGRRTGKTTGILAPNEYRAIRSMPHGVGIFLGNSAAQLKTRTVPAFMSAMRDMYGLVEGQHFTWGRPPASLGFAEPHIKPRDYKNVIQFWNGWIYHLVSLEVKGSANGITSNRITADEARYLNKDKLDSEVMPTLSGIPGFDLNNPFYKSTLYVSDAALTLKQDWMTKEESKMEACQEVIEDIRSMLAYIDSLTAQHGKHDGLAMAKGVIRALDAARCKAFFMGKYNTLSNLDIVGEDYIAAMYRDLPDIVFRISILNETKRKANDGFYSSFNPDLHVYVPDASSIIDGAVTVKKSLVDAHGRKLSRPAEYESTDYGRYRGCELDADLDHTQPLHIAFDYNANINCMCVGQRKVVSGLDSILVLKSLYVKNERKLRELCQDFCDYYNTYALKQVFYYYDQTAKFGNYAERNAKRFFQIVQEELSKRGWNVMMVDIGQAMKHEAKQQLLNDMFMCVEKPYIRINQENNDFLIVAIENTGVSNKSYGWGKDKSGEKKAESEESQLQYRTDITDAFDSLIIGMRNYSGSAYGLGLSRCR